MKKPRRKEPSAANRQNGFTLIELLVLIALAAVLMLTLLPAHASSQTKARSVRCLDNLRQIMGAVLMYTHDNHDLLPPNPDDATTQLGYTWCQGLASVGSATQFNPDILADPTRCLITTYINTNVSLFRCTADTRTGRYQGTNAARIGTIVPAARTISMSQAVGTIDPGYNSGGGHSGKPTLPVNGGWLSGVYGGNTAARGPWRTYGKISQMVLPLPANLWVLAEEEPLSINDATLSVSAGTSEWIDFPGAMHNLACVVAFGDGHTEVHKWVDPRMRLTAPPSLKRVPSNDPDWLWFSARTSARF